MGDNSVVAGRDQLFCFRRMRGEGLPVRRLAWAVLEAAGQLDMTPFVAWYRADGQRRRPYDRRLLVGLVMSCRCKGIRSSRAMGHPNGRLR